MSKRLLLTGVLLVACAHKPDINVSVIHMGAFYPPLAENCPVDLVNGEHTAILVSGEYEQLGLISFSGSNSDLERAMSAIPGAVSAAACKMGGDTVSIANAMNSSSGGGAVQFSVWKSRKQAPAADPSPAAAAHGSA